MSTKQFIVTTLFFITASLSHAQYGINWLDTTVAPLFQGRFLDALNEETAYIKDFNSGFQREHATAMIHKINVKTAQIEKSIELSDPTMDKAQLFSMGVLLLGDSLYQYSMQREGEKAAAFVKLTQLNSFSLLEKNKQLRINNLTLKKRHFIRTHCHTSPNKQFTVVYSYSVKQFLQKDKLEKTHISGSPGAINKIKIKENIQSGQDAITVFDHDGNKLWEKNWNWDRQGTRIRPTEVHVKNDGSIYILAHDDEAQTTTGLFKSSGFHKPQSNVLYFLKKELERPQQVQLTEGSNLPYLEGMLFHQEEGKHYVAASGYIGNRKDQNRQGIYVFAFDQHNQQTGSTFFEADHKLLGTYLTIRQVKRAAKGKKIKTGIPVLKYFGVRNERYFIAVEEYTNGSHSSSHTSFSQNQATGVTSTNTTNYSIVQHLYHNLVIFNGDPSGEIRWTSQLSKKQEVGTASNSPGSVFIMGADDGFSVIYNSTQGIKFPTIGPKKKADHRLVHIDLEGTKVYDEIIKRSTDSILPGSCFKVSGSSAVITINGKDRSRIGLLQKNNL